MRFQSGMDGARGGQDLCFPASRGTLESAFPQVSPCALLWFRGLTEDKRDHQHPREPGVNLRGLLSVELLTCWAFSQLPLVLSVETPKNAAPPSSTRNPPMQLCVRQRTRSTTCHCCEVQQPTRSTTYHCCEVRQPTRSTTCHCCEVRQPTRSTTCHCCEVRQPTRSTTCHCCEVRQRTRSTTCHCCEVRQPTRSTTCHCCEVQQRTRSTTYHCCEVRQPTWSTTYHVPLL
ncbi:uncharacterized protein LOC126950952 [Macaca thibetana thibetana]|uniref:uncharacterized protein LOC126950952 n=1 Tax=Macaca thibetana thibetana TaxID=257877 RepID=UPI0021BCC8C5|nr:uncharacterized protein LOC126950952 [Macaca thibetana thibetana]